MKIEFLGGNTKEEIEKRLQMVSASGVLSRAEGTVTQVLESRNSYEKNLNLIKAIVSYGHRSISEHDYLVFALENVTPIIEQILIHYRLCSFTVKSRREGDFQNAGFYTPNFKDHEGKILKNNHLLQEKYNHHMKSLFYEYGVLADQSIPYEDCRYLLPYSYYSNFIMGCNAHEFFYMTSDLLYGKNSSITEVHDLGTIFKQIIEDYVPYLKDSLILEGKKDYYDDKLYFLDSLVTKDNQLNSSLLNQVHMFDYTENADQKVILSTLMNRYQISDQKALKLLQDMQKRNPSVEEDIISAILYSKKQRELEHAIFSYQVPISLAALTHLTRHRMQSLQVPEFVNFNLDHYIIPDTIRQDHKEQYEKILSENKKMKESFEQEGVSPNDLVYFLLSGNACNVTTTMNARTLEWISRMRGCNKAQWEIRNLVNQMMEEASLVAPFIGKTLGASCKVFGVCPEGKDSCKNKKLVKRSQNKTQ